MNNPDTKISVIIPIYNSEKYLEKCLKTILLQTYSNLEIICVDDGSTDDSYEVLRKLAKADKRLKIYRKENGGTSSARNYGLKKATGDYISFIDSDDWLILSLYEHFVNTLNKINQPIDIYMFNVASYFEGQNDVVPHVFFSINEWTNHKSDLTIHTMNDCQNLFERNLSAANKIYRKNFLLNNSIQFEEGVKFEDQYFHIKTFLRAKSILINESVYYRYRNYNQGSISTSSTAGVFDIFKITNLVSEEFKLLNCYEKYKYALFVYKYTSYFIQYKICPEELKQRYYDEMRKQIVAILPDLDIVYLSKLPQISYVMFLLNHSIEEFKKLTGL